MKSVKQRVIAMTKRSDSVLSEVMERLGRVEDDPLRTAFLVRGIMALLQIAERLDQGELGQAVASSNDATALLTALAQPSAVGFFAATDPLMPARIRGLQAREDLLAVEGGTLSAEAVGARLHISRQAVDKRRAAGKLLAVEIGRRGYLYPAWQLAENGAVPGIEELLALLAGHSPLAKVRFFVSGNLYLNGDRPLDRLRGGDLEAVRHAARTFGEQSSA